MRNKTTLSITLALGAMLLSISGLSSNVHAQFGMLPVANTGLVKLQPNETLTITVAGSKRFNRLTHVDFVWTGYRWSPGLDGIMTYSPVFTGVSGADVDKDGAISFDVPKSQGGLEATGGVQVEVNCHPPYLCVAEGQIFRVGKDGKEYVGHVTLIR